MTEEALYTPATLARIRAGASAADLGWPQEHYARVCDQHRIERRPDVVVSTKTLRRSVLGQVSYNGSTGIIHRGYNDVLLSTQREKFVFEHLFSIAAADDETFVPRTELMELGGKCSEQAIRHVMYRLSDRLAPVKCRIMSSFGKNGGYRLVVEP